MKACASKKQLSFYECFKQTAQQTEENEFFVTYRFSYCDRDVILKKTLKKANRHTVISCEGNGLLWEQTYPCGFFPAKESFHIGNDAFAEKDALNLYVISGKPDCIRNLDTGMFCSAANTASGGICVLSEARLRSFEPF